MPKVIDVNLPEIPGTEHFYDIKELFIYPSSPTEVFEYELFELQTTCSLISTNASLFQLLNVTLDTSTNMFHLPPLNEESLQGGDSCSYTILV